MNVALLGKKIGMTQVFDENNRLMPVTQSLKQDTMPSYAGQVQEKDCSTCQWYYERYLVKDRYDDDAVQIGIPSSKGSAPPQKEHRPRQHSVTSRRLVSSRMQNFRSSAQMAKRTQRR